MKFQARGGDATQHTLGRGILYIKGDTRFQGATPVVEPWRDFGNVTAFTVTQESESKKHRSYLSGIAVDDLDVPISQTMGISFQADELSVQNLALFLSGTLHSKSLDENITNAAAIDSDNAAISSGDRNFFVDTAASDYIYDLWYDMQLNLPLVGMARAYDFEAQGVQAISVRKQTTTNVSTDGSALTEGTHYEIDRKMGRIRFLAVAGGISRGDTFQVKWAAPVDAYKSLGFDLKLNKISLLTNSGLTVSLKFIGANPNDADAPYELEFHKVKLKPDGELAAIGDDWGTLGFTGTAEAISSPQLHSSGYGRLVTRDVYNT